MSELNPSPRLFALELLNKSAGDRRRARHTLIAAARMFTTLPEQFFVDAGFWIDNAPACRSPVEYAPLATQPCRNDACAAPQPGV